jgi:hypothetical protein
MTINTTPLFEYHETSGYSAKIRAKWRAEMMRDIIDPTQYPKRSRHYSILAVRPWVENHGMIEVIDYFIDLLSTESDRLEALANVRCCKGHDLCLVGDHDHVQKFIKHLLGPAHSDPPVETLTGLRG